MPRTVLALALAALLSGGCAAIGIGGADAPPPPPPPRRSVTEAAAVTTAPAAPSAEREAAPSREVSVSVEDVAGPDTKREIRESIRGIQQDLKDGKINSKDAEKRIKGLRKELEASSGGNDVAAKLKELAGLGDRVDSMERRLILIEEKLDDLAKRLDAR